MARAGRTCSDRTSGDTCPRRAGPTGRCEVHEKAHERARGTRQARGYDKDFDRARLKAARDVLAGRAVCWRCDEPITPGTPWDLGHGDGGSVAGPEHRGRCNRRAAGLKAHGLPWTGPET